MPPSSRIRFLPLWFFLGGLAFATWLNVFAGDAKRPIAPQERADRLAAENYAALAFTAPVPPSPAHWAQLQVWQDPVSGARSPLSRDSAALAIALCGGRAPVAGVLAFAFAAAALGWCLLSFGPAIGRTGALVAALALVGVAHGRAWQMLDPFPFLLLASAAFAFGAWTRFRVDSSPRNARLLGLGGAALLLCAPALAITFAVACFVDFRGARQTLSADRVSVLRRLSPALLLLLPVFLFWGFRNQALLGSPLASPWADYAARHVSAPGWFWQTLAVPPANPDPVLERYDELVAVPSARWTNPVYQAWLTRLSSGGAYAGGALLALVALITAFAVPFGQIRSACLLGIAISVTALLRYPLSSTWWMLLTPAIVVLAAQGISRLPAASGTARAKIILGLLFGHVLTLASAPVAKPSEPEYLFEKNLREVSKKILEQPGRHLVFVSLESTVDGQIEPAHLPRDWESQAILFARDLGPERNSALAASLPGLRTWRVLIDARRIGLQAWQAPGAVPSVAPAP